MGEAIEYREPEMADMLAGRLMDLIREQTLNETMKGETHAPPKIL